MEKTTPCCGNIKQDNSENNKYRDNIQRLFYSQKYEKKRNIPTKFHFHNVTEIYFLIEGKCKFFIDDATYELKPGDIVIIPPDVLHKAYYDKNIPITRYVLYFDPAMLLPKVNNALLSTGYYIKKLMASISDIEQLFEKIQKENNRPDEISESLVQGYLASIAALVLRNPKNKDNIEIKSKSQLIETAISCVKNNYSSNISLEDTAKELSVSYLHLSRKFKAETGIGFNEFLNLYRLRQAKFMLLACRSKSISEIAYDCGFNDSNYFAVRFKKLFGISPSQFRSGKTSTKHI